MTNTTFFRVGVVREEMERKENDNILKFRESAILQTQCFLLDSKPTDLPASPPPPTHLGDEEQS